MPHQNNTAHKNLPESVAQYAREALAEAPICEEERDFLEAFLDPPWLVEALVAWVLVHCGKMIIAENYVEAASVFRHWAEDTGVFHDALGERIRQIFVGTVIMSAKRILLEQKKCALN